MLNESDKSGHRYLVPDLREKAFRFSALSKILPQNKFNQRGENLYTEKYDIDERD